MFKTNKGTKTEPMDIVQCVYYSVRAGIFFFFFVKFMFYYKILLYQQNLCVLEFGIALVSA